MKIIGDLHCHTIASIHAYNTIWENIGRARDLGYEFLAITDHGGDLPNCAPYHYFDNLEALPRHVDGVTLLRGVETNIVDYEGTIDIPEWLLKKLDIIIASMHTQLLEPGTVEDHTNAYLGVAKNPYVRVIGHSGTKCYTYDFEKVIPVFKEYGKVVELNTHTFICRKDSIPNCRQIIGLCKKYELPILVNSDAHVITEMGLNDEAFKMLDELDFPEKLVINASRESMLEYLERIGVDLGNN